MPIAAANPFPDIRFPKTESLPAPLVVFVELVFGLGLGLPGEFSTGAAALVFEDGF
jgi:hypothetical protein